jgi:anhydro-N-acetylmuramic acid kinase
MRVLGMISGTSHDAIEVAVADLDLSAGEIAAKLLGSASVEFPAALRAAVAAALPPSSTSLEAVCQLDTLLGQAFAEAAATVAARFAPVELVVSHGQTLYHWVEGRAARGTLQLGEASWIAERVGVPVVSGLRARDIAAGGHGAPLVSTLDVMLLSGHAATTGAATGHPGALNLGGIANLTVVDPSGPVAFDIGPANALLDATVVALTGGTRTYDAEGAWAAGGSVDDTLLDHLLSEPYYGLEAPKSTGKELFSAKYLFGLGIDISAHDPSDLLATLTALTAQTVVEACRRYGVTDVIMAGGGTRNTALVAALEQRAAGRIRFSVIDELGIPSSAKEAYAFALLGFLTWNGLTGTVASCTGATGPRTLGSITPGSGPLVLPEPAVDVPRRLVVTAPDPASRPSSTGVHDVRRRTA